MPDRSKVMIQTKRDVLVWSFRLGLGVGLTTSPHKKVLFRNLKICLGYKKGESWRESIEEAKVRYGL
jgi:hypothetical protein